MSSQILLKHWLPVVSAISLLAAACGGRPATAQPNAAPGAQPIPVRVGTVETGSVTTQLELTGDIRPRTTVVIAPKLGGKVTRLTVESGNRVTRGQVLAELDRAGLEAQLQQAEAGVVAAEARAASVAAGPRAGMVEQAQANAQAAREKLASLRAGGRAESVAQAQSSVETARARLDQMIEGGRPETIAQAEANLEAARARLRTLENGPRIEDVAIAKSNLDAAQARLDQLLVGPTPEQIRIAETNVRIARNSLNNTLSQADLQASRGLIGQGQKDAMAGVGYEQVRLAEEQLAQVLAGPTPEQIAQARSAVAQAQQTYQKAANPFTEQDLAQARAAVWQAEEAVTLARYPYTEADIATARAQLEAATAQAALAANPYTSFDIAQAAAAAEAAQAGVTMAANPVTREDIEAAQATVDQAKAQVELARVSLDDATIESPIDGIVSDVQGVVGGLTGPTSPLLTIISPDLEVVLTIDESQLPLIDPGQAVQFEVSAYPGRPFTGQVRTVSPTVDQRTRTGTAKITITPGGPGKLVAGMFAEVKVTTAQRTGVLLVPKTALLERDGKNYVFVIEEATARRREVTTGSPADKDRVEVTRGLAAGDQVALNPLVLHDGDQVTIFQG